MDYKQTIEYLYNSAPVFEHVGASAYKEGLDNTYALDKHFGHPHRRYTTIHIAGTNGKGSCAHSLAAILQSQGKKVGLYTSPHLVDFRERIRVNGKCISQEYVTDFVENERAFFEPLHPSFFELTTAMAFRYFADSGVDVAVIEVGLGGRLDCTNIITPQISVITNISYDHTQFLGDTLSQIAMEKAGIIKTGVPVVIGETTDETKPVFLKKAQDMQAPVIFAEEKPEIVSHIYGNDGLMHYQTRSFGQVDSELCGDYQVKNMNTILTASKAMGIKGDLSPALAHVCELTGLMGRWQTLADHPHVVCDTGHNVGGWKYLAKQLKRQRCHKMHIVFGMVDDKDIDKVMELLPQSATYYWTQASTHRAIPVKTVAKKGEEHHLTGKPYDTVLSAYTAAITHADVDDFVFVGGSSYVVADLLSGLAVKKHTYNLHEEVQESAF